MIAFCLGSIALFFLWQVQISLFCFSQSWGDYRSQSKGLDHPWREPRNVSSQTTDLCIWFFKYSPPALSINSYFIWTEHPLLSNNLHCFPLTSLLTSISLTIRQFSKSVIFELSWFSFLFWFISRLLVLSLSSMPFFLNIFVKDSLTPAVPNVLLSLLAKAFALDAVLWISRWALLLKSCPFCSFK